MYGMQTDEVLRPELPSCGGCHGDPDGDFEGYGSMGVSVMGTPMHFSWLTRYSFNASSGLMEASMNPIENPWPHPISAFDCPGVPYSISSFDVCNISMMDDCLRAAQGENNDPSDVFWNGADNITQIQYTHGPFGSTTTVVHLMRVHAAGGGNVTNVTRHATR